MQSGLYAGHRVKLRASGRTPDKPFRYRDLGSAAYISRGRAVVTAGPLRTGGFIAWWIWLFIHIAFLTGYRNRVGAVLTARAIPGTLPAIDHSRGLVLLACGAIELAWQRQLAGGGREKVNRVRLRPALQRHRGHVRRRQHAGQDKHQGKDADRRYRDLLQEVVRDHRDAAVVGLLVDLRCLHGVTCIGSSIGRTTPLART